MKERFGTIGILLAVLLVLSAGLSTAQGPAPQGQAALQAAVGSAFAYQGELKKDGTLINATCAMTFTLYDHATTGSPVGSPINANVAVADGLFTAALDFGASVFTGDARWLEVAVKCPGDAHPNTLDPRQPLLAAPYALSLQPGAVISGTVLGAPLGAGAALTVRNSASASGTSGIYGRADSTAGVGVRGYAAAATGDTAGVYGRANSPDGSGVHGANLAASGSALGVYGETASTAGRAVYGAATAASGIAYGVVGASYSTDGRGVYGVGASTTGLNYGVYGHTNSTGGRGVYGYANAVSGSAYGVHGESESTSGRGVSGYVLATAGTNFGVFGRSDSTSGRGVGGVVFAASGETYGVHGVSASTAGRGVGGFATATAGTTYGVYGETQSSTGVGVSGIANDSACMIETTNYCAGVFGDSDFGVGAYGRTDSGIAVYGYAHGGGVALRAAGQSTGNLIEAWHWPSGPDLEFYVSSAGNVYADGTYSSPAEGFAQMLPGAAGLEAGDVLVVGADGLLARCNAAYQPTVVGVHAPQAAFVAGGSEAESPGQLPLAVMGVVKVKASAENGPIAAGDLLVAAATPGHAMAAGANAPQGTVVGKAMGALDEGTGTILMLIMAQ